MKGIHSSNQESHGFLGGHLVHPSALRRDQLSSCLPFQKSVCPALEGLQQWRSHNLCRQSTLVLCYPDCYESFLMSNRNSLL